MEQLGHEATTIIIAHILTLPAYRDMSSNWGGRENIMVTPSGNISISLYPPASTLCAGPRSVSQCPDQDRRLERERPPTSSGNRRRAYKQKGTVEMSHKVKMSS